MLHELEVFSMINKNTNYSQSFEFWRLYLSLLGMVLLPASGSIICMIGVCISQGSPGKWKIYDKYIRSRIIMRNWLTWLWKLKSHICHLQAGDPGFSMMWLWLQVQRRPENHVNGVDSRPKSWEDQYLRLSIREEVKGTMFSLPPFYSGPQWIG